jgi:hypothetical protein
MMHKIRITESGLDRLREEAARTGQVRDAGVVAVGAPFPQHAPSASYHGNPVLKAPTWTWEIPLYFFAGAAAGTSAAVALAAHLFGLLDVMRIAMWVALAGAIISPPLLIADLGRPERFLNMLRVFKLRSAMSMGAWTLVAFSNAAVVAVLCREAMRWGYAVSALGMIEWVAQIFAALIGAVLASYTSVLLGVSAIPVWSENRRVLPAVFLAGGLGSTAAILTLAGFTLPAIQMMGVLASLVETGIAVLPEFRRRYVDLPLRQGAVGWLVRLGGLLAGPVSLVLRVFPGAGVELRYAAAISFIVGAVITRYAWIAAGHVSARDPQALFSIQQKNAS